MLKLAKNSKTKIKSVGKMVVKDILFPTNLTIYPGRNRISDKNLEFLSKPGDTLSYYYVSSVNSYDAVCLQIYYGNTFVSKINTFRPFILNNGQFTITTSVFGTRTSTFNSGVVINSNTYRITF